MTPVLSRPMTVTVANCFMQGVKSLKRESLHCQTGLFPMQRFNDARVHIFGIFRNFSRFRLLYPA